MTDWLNERSLNGSVDEIPLPSVAGRLWLCGKHFIGPDPDTALERAGANTVVCLCEAAELTDRYPAYVEWLRARPADLAIWFPVPDLHAPDFDATLGFLSGLIERLGSGQRILMHCGAGIGRAGTLAAAVLISLGVPRAAAVETVAIHRPMAGPEAGAQLELLGAIEDHYLTKAAGARPPT